jgi:hypothetical protein
MSGGLSGKARPLSGFFRLRNSQARD